MTERDITIITEEAFILIPTFEIVHGAVGGKPFVWASTKRKIERGELKVGVKYRIHPNGEVELADVPRP